MAATALAVTGCAAATALAAPAGHRCARRAGRQRRARGHGGDHRADGDRQRDGARRLHAVRRATWPWA